MEGRNMEKKEGRKEREREKESVRVSRHLSRGHTCRALLESRKGDSPAKSNPISLFLSPSPSPTTRATTGGTLKRDKLEPPFRTKPTLSLSLSFELLSLFPSFQGAPRFDNGAPPMIPRFSQHLSPPFYRRSNIIDGEEKIIFVGKKL